MANDVIKQLNQLLARWDEMAEMAEFKGDVLGKEPQRAAFQYGVMLGLELCRDDLAQIVADTTRIAAQQGS
jgi:hypothetical protein